MKELRYWLYGLFSTGISAAANSITACVIDPVTFNFETGIHNVITMAGVAALIAIAHFLSRSPLPGRTESRVEK
jgi:uncharacterized membrane-anchored protein